MLRLIMHTFISLIVCPIPYSPNRILSIQFFLYSYVRYPFFAVNKINIVLQHRSVSFKQLSTVITIQSSCDDIRECFATCAGSCFLQACSHFLLSEEFSCEGHTSEDGFQQLFSVFANVDVKFFSSW